MSLRVSARPRISGMNHCHRCKSYLPVAVFSRDRRRSNGLQSICKPCARKLKAGWFQDHKQAVTDRVRGYRQANPDKHAAHLAVSRALDTRKIIRPKKCQTCAKVARLDAHHADYSKPLEVMWLCRSCHIAEHAKQPVSV